MKASRKKRMTIDGRVDPVSSWLEVNEKNLKPRPSRDVWLVWATRKDHRGQEVTDMRSIEETELGADFVKAILARDEPDATIWIEKRITHHIYAHRDVAMALRLIELRNS